MISAMSLTMGVGREEFAAPLPLGQGEPAQEVLVRRGKANVNQSEPSGTISSAKLCRSLFR